MNACLCGNSVDVSGTLCNRCIALRIMELDTDSTDAEVRASYRTLAEVWRPDRFASDGPLKEEAETKLKDINSAYEFLTMTLTERATWRRPRRWAEDPALNGVSLEAEAAAKRKRIALFKRIRGLSRFIVPALKNAIFLVVMALMLLFCRYLWIAFDVPGPTRKEVARAYDESKNGALKELEEPKRRFLFALEKDLRKMGIQWSAPGPEAPPQPEQAAPEADTQPVAQPVAQAARKASAKTPVQQPAHADIEPQKIYPFITIGSTKEEVLAQHGPPTASSDSKLVYGRSEIYLRDGAVIGWKIDPLTDPIRVKLWPHHPVDTSQEYFTVDSTKDDVLVVQGTPTAFSKDKYEYGGSEVYFENDRVVRWKSDPASIPLRVKLP